MQRGAAWCSVMQRAIKFARRRSFEFVSRKSNVSLDLSLSLSSGSNSWLPLASANPPPTPHRVRDTCWLSTLCHIPQHKLPHTATHSSQHSTRQCNKQTPGCLAHLCSCHSIITSSADSIVRFLLQDSPVVLGLFYKRENALCHSCIFHYSLLWNLPLSSSLKTHATLISLFLSLSLYSSRELPPCVYLSPFRLLSPPILSCDNLCSSATHCHTNCLKLQYTAPHLCHHSTTPPPHIPYYLCSRQGHSTWAYL